jgi:hypothetical protein
MMESLPFRASRFAKNVPWCNVDINWPSAGAPRRRQDFPAPNAPGEYWFLKLDANLTEILP